MDLYHFPEDLQQIIDEIAGGPDEDEAAVARGVLLLSDLFIGRSAWQAEYGSRADLRRAYLRYYLPVNLPKLRVPLAAWLQSQPRGVAAGTLRCLDLGSGPGTALLGI